MMMVVMIITMTTVIMTTKTSFIAVGEGVLKGRLYSVRLFCLQKQEE